MTNNEMNGEQKTAYEAYLNAPNGSPAKKQAWDALVDAMKKEKERANLSFRSDKVHDQIQRRWFGQVQTGFSSQADEQQYGNIYGEQNKDQYKVILGGRQEENEALNGGEQDQKESLTTVEWARDGCEENGGGTEKENEQDLGHVVDSIEKPSDAYSSKLFKLESFTSSEGSSKSFRSISPNDGLLDLEQQGEEKNHFQKRQPPFQAFNHQNLRGRKGSSLQNSDHQQIDDSKEEQMTDTIFQNEPRYRDDPSQEEDQHYKSTLTIANEIFIGNKYDSPSKLRKPSLPYPWNYWKQKYWKVFFMTISLIAFVLATPIRKSSPTSVSAPTPAPAPAPVSNPASIPEPLELAPASIPESLELDPETISEPLELAPAPSPDSSAKSTISSSVPDSSATELVTDGSFENNTTSWFAFGPVTLSVDTTTKHSGLSSILVSNRISGSWNAIAQDVTGVILPGKSYNISFWIRLKNSDTETVKLTISTTDDDDKTKYHSVASLVEGQEWTHVVGTKKLDDSASEFKKVVIYIEGPAEGVDYWVDDISITSAIN